MCFHIFLSFQLLPFCDWSSPVTLPLTLLIHRWHLNPPRSPQLSFPQMISAPCNFLLEITCLNFRVLLMSNELMAPLIVLWLNHDCSLTKVALDRMPAFDRGKGKAKWRDGGWYKYGMCGSNGSKPLAGSCPASVLLLLLQILEQRESISLPTGLWHQEKELRSWHTVTLKVHSTEQLPNHYALIL